MTTSMIVYDLHVNNNFIEVSRTRACVKSDSKIGIYNL